MSYRARLRNLDYSRTLATPTTSRLVLLTGQSAFATSRLTPAQTEFLTEVAPPHAEVLKIGFPFHPDFDIDAGTPGIVAASMRNTLQVFWSRYSSTYRETVARALQPLFTNTGDSLYILTGSCGLQLLASAWPLLEKAKTLSICVIAIGPAGPAMPNAIAVQGKKDLWSKLLYRGPVTARCNTGHLDYWDSTEVRRIVTELLSNPCESHS